MKYVHTKQRGIGLLELMLSMVIIAIVTLMSIQYFGSSKRNTMTTKAIDEIQAIVSIVAGMPAPPSGASNMQALSNAVVMSGQLPAVYAYGAGTNYYIGTPWTTESGGALTTSSTSSFTVKVENGILTIGSIGATGTKGLPDWACQSIIDKYGAASTSADCVSGLNLQFKLKMDDNIYAPAAS